MHADLIAVCALGSFVILLLSVLGIVQLT